MSCSRLSLYLLISVALVVGGWFSTPTVQANFCSPFENCFNDGDCTQGFCRNRVCQCNVGDPGICGDRCPDRGYCYPGACGGNTIHITDCRGISTGGNGGVISYCDQNPCDPNQGNACQKCNSCGMCGNGTIQCDGSCSATRPSDALCGVPPIGSHDVADCAADWGWSFDADYAGSVSVHIYRDGPAGVGTFMAAVTANMSRPDVGAVYPGRTNSGWSWPIPGSMQDGLPHTLYAYAINVNSAGAPNGPNPLLPGSPKSITCNNPPTGVLSAAACGSATGSATDPQGSPVTVEIYDGVAGAGGTLIGTGAAGPSFTIPFAAFTDGQTHNINAYAQDRPSGTRYQLTGTVPVTCAPAVSVNAAPLAIPFAGSSNVSWTVSNGSSCTATPANWFNPASIINGSGNGSKAVSPLTATTTFKLTCTNSAGVSATDSKTVTVSVPPPTGSITGVTDSDYCSPPPGMVIDWRYESPGSAIASYQVQVLDASNTVIYDSGQTTYSQAPDSSPVAQESAPLYRPTAFERLMMSATGLISHLLHD